MVEVEGVKANEVAGPVEEAITLPQQVNRKVYALHSESTSSTMGKKEQQTK